MSSINQISLSSTLYDIQDARVDDLSTTIDNIDDNVSTILTTVSVLPNSLDAIKTVVDNINKTDVGVPGIHTLLSNNLNNELLIVTENISGSESIAASTFASSTVGDILLKSSGVVAGNIYMTSTLFVPKGTKVTMARNIASDTAVQENALHAILLDINDTQVKILNKGSLLTDSGQLTYIATEDMYVRFVCSSSLTPHTIYITYPSINSSLAAILENLYNVNKKLDLLLTTSE